MLSKLSTEQIYGWMDEWDVDRMITADGGARYTLEGGTSLLLSYVAILDPFGSAHVGRSGVAMT